MVKAVVDQMFEHEPNTTRAICHKIFRSIVRDCTKISANVGERNGDILLRWL